MNVAQAALDASGMTQAQFCRSYRFSDRTLHQWLAGDRTPRGPTRTLLECIAKDPQLLLTLINR